MPSLAFHANVQTGPEIMQRADDVLDGGDGFGYHENYADFWDAFVGIASKVPGVVTAYARKTLLPRMRDSGNSDFAVTMLDGLARANPECVKPIAAEVLAIAGE